MNTKLKILGLILIGIGLGYLGTDLLMTAIDQVNKTDIPDEQPDQVEVQDQTVMPFSLQILGYDLDNGTVTKKYTHRDTEIIYSVKVENGVEATPGPSVLQAIEDSMTEYEKQQSEEYHKSLLYERMGDLKDWYLKSKIHRSSDSVKKEYLDSVFTCENYQLLAWQWKADQLGGGTAEDYIYTKANNECINPKHQEEIDKVHHELEEAYAESLEDVDTTD